jgi:hypothetical protein
MQRWGIEEPSEVAGLSHARLAEELQAAIDHGIMSPLARAVFTEVGSRYVRAGAVMGQYMDWFEDSPEDSWRLQRDLCAAIALPENGCTAWHHGSPGCTCPDPDRSK